MRCNGRKKNRGEGFQAATRREEEKGRASYSGILILSGRTYLRKFVFRKKGAMRETVTAMRTCSLPFRYRFAAGRRFLAKTFVRRRKGDTCGTKETSVVGDECRKQSTWSNATSRLWRVVSREDSISQLLDNRSSISDAVSLPFPHEKPGELIFDKGPLNFFVKQNLTRCRRTLGNPGKKYLRVAAKRHI